MLKVNSQNNSTRCKTCFKLTIKASERRQLHYSLSWLWTCSIPYSSTSIVDFKYVISSGMIYKFCFSSRKNMCAPWSHSTEIKNITHFLLLKAHPLYQRYQCSFALWATLQTSKFCHWWIFSLILCDVKLW